MSKIVLRLLPLVLLGFVALQAYLRPFDGLPSSVVWSLVAVVLYFVFWHLLVTDSKKQRADFLVGIAASMSAVVGFWVLVMSPSFNSPYLPRCSFAASQADCEQEHEYQRLDAEARERGDEFLAHRDSLLTLDAKAEVRDESGVRLGLGVADKEGVTFLIPAHCGPLPAGPIQVLRRRAIFTRGAPSEVLLVWRC